MNAKTLWGLLFRAYVVLLALLVISYPFQQPGSKGRIITLVCGGLILVSLVVLALLIHWEWDPF